MEDKVFQIEQRTYAQRFRKKFLFGFVVLTAVIAYVYFENTNGGIFTALVVGLVVGTIYTLIQLYKTRTFIYYVEFAGLELVLKGYTFNTGWTDRLNIHEMAMELKTEPTRSNVEFYYIIRSKDKAFQLNRTFDWDYFTLLEIFREFKSRKGEKIIFDEKYYLDMMGKKANGVSHWDIVWAKDLKKKE